MSFASGSNTEVIYQCRSSEKKKKKKRGKEQEGEKTRKTKMALLPTNPPSDESGVRHRV